MKVLRNNKNIINREEEGGETLVRRICIRKTAFSAIGKRG